MRPRLAHRVGRSLQATTAAVDKSFERLTHRNPDAPQVLRVTARQRMHAPIGRQHDWLSSVLRGHYAYYGLRSNISCLETFYQEVRRIWFRALHRRSQRGLSWAAYGRLLERFPLPTPSIRAPAASAHV
jgi:hypothetical protein